jgi:hypothetical protein
MRAVVQLKPQLTRGGIDGSGLDLLAFPSGKGRGN